jgi:hypothetical protein
VGGQRCFSCLAEVSLNPGMTWGGRRLPTLLELAIVVVLGVITTVIAVMRFSGTE